MTFSSEDKEHLLLAEQDLARSGLTLEDAEQLGLDIMGHEQTFALGHHDLRPALVFPYWDPFANKFIDPKEFHRVRFLGSSGGFASQTKERRYGQPKGTLNSVYIPRMVAGKLMDWKACLTAGRDPIYFTEGEKKAACGCKFGLPMLGLGGVEVFRAQKRGVLELPILADIDFRGREVRLVFDTDTESGLKDSVLLAAQRLMDYFAMRGAMPLLVVLPTGPDGQKMGIDDFLVAEGVEKFLDEVFPKNQLLHDGALKLCDAANRFVYVNSIGRFMAIGSHPGDDPKIPKTRQQLDETLHMSKVAVPVLKSLREQTGWTTKLIPTPTPISEALLMFGGLNRCKTMVYAPGQPRVVEREQAQHLNLWEGWKCEYEDSTAHLPSELERQRVLSEWNWAMDNVFGEDPIVRDFVEHWIYYPLRHPGAKLNTFMLVCSPLQGIGKSFLGDMLAEHVYGLRGSGRRHASKIVEGRLEGDFNSFMYATSFVVGEEIASHNKRSVYERVKSFVTSDTVEINIKNIPQFTTENCSNFWLSSNEGAPFFLAERDRRAFVHIPTRSKKNSERFSGLARMFEQGLGGPTLLWYARERHEFKAFNPKDDAPMTQGKQDVIQNSMSGIREYLGDVMAAADAGLLTRPFCTMRELVNFIEHDAPHLYKQLSDRGLGHMLNDCGAVRYREGKQVTYRLEGVGRRERVWVLGEAQNTLSSTEDEISEALAALPFSHKNDKVVQLRKAQKY